MTKLFSALALGAAAWISVAAVASGPLPAGQAGVETDRTLQWRVLSNRDDQATACRIALRDAGEGYAIAIPSGCADLPAMLTGASVWREDAHGNVVLEDLSGARLAEFGPAEFDGLLSVYPRHLDLALLPAD